MLFILKKTIAAFILPPGIFVAALAAASFYFRRRCKGAAWCCAVLAALLWAGTTAVFSDLLLRPLEYAYQRPAAPAGDVIIVLGGGAYDAADFFSAGESLQPASLARVSAAALLYRKTGLPVMVSGGPVFTRIAEAEAAAAYLEELGVPAKAVIKEGLARDTWENALFTRKLCAERGYKKVIVLSSASHMPRAMYLFHKAGFADIVPFPVNRTAEKGKKYCFRDYLPGAAGGAREALNEYVGLLYSRLL